MPDRRVLIWLPGLAVACGAAVATAHGLYEVALAARVPAGIAWLYPLITDGLALVAYAATARLSGSAARYAWAVVVAAAGLSGLAQAAWLAADGLIAAPVLRFGIGAWPAIAAAVVAHLLYLLIDTTPQTDNAVDDTVRAGVHAAVQRAVRTRSWTRRPRPRPAGHRGTARPPRRGRSAHERPKPRRPTTPSTARCPPCGPSWPSLACHAAPPPVPWPPSASSRHPCTSSPQAKNPSPKERSQP